MRWGQADRLWKKWDAALKDGMKPSDFLCDLSDESLVQLLLASPPGRDRDRDVVATETFNRMLRTRRGLREVDDHVDKSVSKLVETIRAARPAVHATERFTQRATEGKPIVKSEDEAWELATHASELIEMVHEAMSEAETAAERLNEFRMWRMETARGGADAEE